MLNRSFLNPDSPQIADTDPKEKPEVEPEVLPKENPGIDPEPSPDEDDDDDNPFTEIEIGDDPEHEKQKIPLF